MNTDCQTIIFSDEAYNAIMTETFKKDPLETGGILLGHILDNGIWIVMEVLPPGWRSTFQYAYFEYDEQFVNYVAQNESKKYEQELQLLGLWHRHPGSMDTFSGTDDGTNRTFAGLNPKGAISGLVNIDPRFRLTMYHVSNPLRYTKVDVEVGDDLIPEKYFKWKYYDEDKGLNPFPPEKKNCSPNTERQYEIGSGDRKTTPKDSSIMSAIIRFLDSKNVFFLLFFVGLMLSLCLSFSYYKVKDTEDVKALHKIIYCVAIDDSTLNSTKEILAKDFIENQANTIRKKLQSDSLLINDTINRNEFVKRHLSQQSIIQDSGIYQKTVDSLKTAYDSAWIANEIEKQKNNYIESSKWLWIDTYKDDFYEKLDVQKADSQVKHVAILLWIITGFLLLFAFALRKRNFLCALSKKDKKFWYQQKPQLYLQEESEIRKGFADAEKNVENGVVSFFINTYKKISAEQGYLSFQLVYSADYLANKEIKVYLVSPDLDGLLGDKIKDFPYIAIDGAGESYLDLSKTLPKDKVSGMEIIRKFYEWIQQYNEWKSNRINLRNIKL